MMRGSRQYADFPKRSKFRRNAPLQTKLRSNDQLLSSAVYSQQSTSRHATFITCQRIALLPACLHKKDERALPGILQSPQFFLFPP
jgi:hypothetical protein